MAFRKMTVSYMHDILCVKIADCRFDKNIKRSKKNVILLCASGYADKLFLEINLSRMNDECKKYRLSCSVQILKCTLLGFGSQNCDVNI